MAREGNSPEYEKLYGQREERREQGLPEAGGKGNGGGQGSDGCLIIICMLGLHAVAAVCLLA